MWYVKRVETNRVPDWLIHLGIRANLESGLRRRYQAGLDEWGAKRLARLEGILLDPIYTDKAFAGLLDFVERKQLDRDEPVIFLRTGGLPALFAFDRLW